LGRSAQHLPCPIGSERAVKLHALVLLSDRGIQLLCLGSFYHEVRQSLGLDCHLRNVGYVKPHELENPHGNPSHGEAVSDDFPKPM
jgi:hypothetical protein